MFLIKKKYALYFFLIFPFIKPGLFEYIPLIDNLYNVMRIFSFAYIMTAYYKKMFRNKLFIVIFLFEMISLLGTIIEGGNILRWLMTAAINISAIAITFIWAEDDLYSYIRIVGKYINILLLINLIGIMIYPNGIISTSAGGCNFVDIDNLMFPFLLFLYMLPAAMAFSSFFVSRALGHLFSSVWMPRSLANCRFPYSLAWFIKLMVI